MEKDKLPLAAVSFAEFAPQTYAEWKEEATASLKGAPFDKKLLTKTYEGITLEPLYTAAHAAGFGQKDSFPGAADYLRGSRPSGYVASPWLIVQQADAQEPAAANAIMKEALAKGADAIAFCPRCLKLGDLPGMAALLEGIDISAAPFNVYSGPSAAPLLGLLKAYCAQQNIDSRALYGVIGADPLAALALNGCLDADIDSYYEQMATAIRWGSKNMPQLETIYIQGPVYHNGGASAVQELAACMATAIAYLDALTERGLSVDEIAGQIRFKLSLGANFFMEIAKLRAARVMWAQIVKAYGGSEAAGNLHVCAATSEFTATVYDPYVNILRATTQAFSGVLGGANALTVTPFDSAVRFSDEHSRRIARNIQVMMQNEFNLLTPIDPAGGSWYVETLTGQLAEQAWQQMQAIEAQGGMLAALQEGSVQAQIAATLAERFKKLASRADRAVGTNMYANMQEAPLARPAGGCDKSTCAAHRQQPAAAAPEVDGCIVSIEAAFAKGAQLAQIVQALNRGQGLSVTAITPHRWTEQFEALRAKTEQSGKEISVFLANMGPLAQHKARADFSTGFIEVGGFKVLGNDGFATVAEAAQAAIASRATATVICSTDDTYPDIVPALTRAIKAEAPQMLVILAGLPAAEHKEAYAAAGLDDSIHVKANCLEVLSKIHKAGGIA